MTFYAALNPIQKTLLFALIVTVVTIGLIQSSPVWFPKVFGVLRSLVRSFFRRSGVKNVASIRIGDLVLTDDDRMRHTHILGATGVGKSVLIEHLLYRDIVRGYGALIIDAKGERDFYEKVKRFCESVGRGSDLFYLSSTFESESACWNPVRLGNVSELQSKFYCAARYDHPHYAKAAELVFLEIFEKCASGGDSKILTLSDFMESLDQVTNYGKDENYKGVYLDFKNLVRGEWAGVLGVREKSGNPTEVSLLDITRNNQILFVDLPTEGKAVQSSRIGALLLQELTLISGLRKRMPVLKSNRPFSVFVDEFDAFATESFVTFLNKGRSSDFMIHLAHQTLSDLKKISPTFEGQIMGNPNVRFVFRMDLAEDAEKISKGFGTVRNIKKTWQLTQGRMSGNGSIRDVQEFRIHPDMIKSFGIGECGVSIKTKKLTRHIKLPMVQIDQISRVMRPVNRPPLGHGEHKTNNITKPKSKDFGAFATGGETK